MDKQVKALLDAARAVCDWDDLHGYGANDDGYNRLAELREAAETLDPVKTPKRKPNKHA